MLGFGPIGTMPLASTMIYASVQFTSNRIAAVTDSERVAKLAGGVDRRAEVTGSASGRATIV